MKATRTPKTLILFRSGLLLLVIGLMLLSGLDAAAAEYSSALSEQHALNALFNTSNTRGVSFGSSISLPKLAYLFCLQMGVIGSIFYFRLYKSLN